MKKKEAKKRGDKRALKDLPVRKSKDVKGGDTAVLSSVTKAQHDTATSTIRNI